MKTLILKYAAACLLLYTCVLSIIVFWHTSNMVVGLLAIVAMVGWMAWWLERFVMSDESRLQQAPAGSFLPAQEPTSVEPVQEPAVEAERVPVRVNQMAEQVRVTLDEAEQAVSVSIKAFKHITQEAKEVAQCAREMMNWGSEKSPLIHSALAHLSERSEHISGNAKSIVTIFQFHDLLRQRLEGIAAYLDTLPDAGADCPEAASETGEQIPSGGSVSGMSLPAAAVNYAPKQGSQTDVTLF